MNQAAQHTMSKALHALKGVIAAEHIDVQTLQRTDRRTGRGVLLAPWQCSCRWPSRIPRPPVSAPAHRSCRPPSWPPPHPDPPAALRTNTNMPHLRGSVIEWMLSQMCWEGGPSWVSGSISGSLHCCHQSETWTKLFKAEWPIHMQEYGFFHPWVLSPVLSTITQSNALLKRHRQC